MPIPADIKALLLTTVEILDRARDREERMRAQARKKEEARLAAEARAAAEAGTRAKEIFAWLAADGAALAMELKRVGLDSVTLVDEPRKYQGYRGTLSLTAAGRLWMSRRSGPAWGDRGEVKSAEELTRRSRPEVVVELANAIRDGSVWKTIRRDLKDAGRRARELVLQDLDSVEVDEEAG